MESTVYCIACGVEISPIDALLTEDLTGGRCMECFNDPSVIKVPCIVCDAAILPTTAERTGGKCMACFEDPSGRETQIFGQRTPTSTLFEMLEEATTKAALNVARSAASALARDRIYGCWLFHSQMTYVYGVTIFTEAGFDKVIQTSLKNGYSHRRRDVRWEPLSSPHCPYLPDEFCPVERLCLALEQKRFGDDDEMITLEFERMCLRVLRRLRAAELFDPKVVLTLAESDQSYEQRLAYAEHFCHPEALEIFRADLHPLKEEEVKHWRSIIPTF